MTKASSYFATIFAIPAFQGLNLPFNSHLGIGTMVCRLPSHQYLLVVSLALYRCVLSTGIYRRQTQTLPLLPNREYPTDAWDHSWIAEYTALGDSYSSGVGCGQRTGYWCSQYDHAFPNLINQDDSLGTEERNFHFLACLGHTTDDVVKNQISTIENLQDLITLTAGGNDVFFSELVQLCVYGYGGGSRAKATCEQQIEASQEAIASDWLLDKLKTMLRAARQKLREHGLAAVYVVLYPKFFDASSTDCDSISWSTWLSWPYYEYLTQERRQTFNDMADALNNRIKEAAAEFDQWVVVVDWQDKIDMVDGKYCEPGVDETVKKGDDREQLIFYEWYSKLDDNYFKSSSADSSLETVPVVGDLNVTLDKAPKNQMNPYQALLLNKFAKDFEYNKTALALAIENDEDIPKDATAVQAAAIWSDKTTRVFHPQYYGHQQMAYAVLSALDDYQARVVEHKKQAPTVTYGCPAPTDKTSPVGVLNRCIQETEEGVVAFQNEDAFGHIDEFCSNNAGRIVLGPPGITRSYEAADKSALVEFHLERRYDGDCERYTGDQKSVLHEHVCKESLNRILTQCDHGPEAKKYGGLYDAECITHRVRGLRNPAENSDHKDPGVMCRSEYNTFKQGDTEHFMTKDDMSAAIKEFCNNLASSKTRIDPGGESSMAVSQGATGIVSWPDDKCKNPGFNWIEFYGMSGAPRVNDCLEHLGIVRDDCDVKDNGFLHYKQGGNQTFQCVTYGIGIGFP